MLILGPIFYTGLVNVLLTTLTFGPYKLWKKIILRALAIQRNHTLSPTPCISRRGESL